MLLVPGSFILGGGSCPLSCMKLHVSVNHLESVSTISYRYLPKVFLVHPTCEDVRSFPDHSLGSIHIHMSPYA